MPMNMGMRWFYLVTFSILFFCYRILYIKFTRKMVEKHSAVHEIGIWIYTFYLIYIFYKTCSPICGFDGKLHADVKVIPLWHLYILFLESKMKAFIYIINGIMLLLPLGFLTPLLWKKYQNLKKMLGLGIGISLMMEFMQLFLNEMTSIDDVLLNLLGVLLGYWGMLVISNIIKMNNNLLNDGHCLDAVYNIFVKSEKITVISIAIFTAVGYGLYIQKDDFRLKGLFRQEYQIVLREIDGEKIQIPDIKLSAESAILVNVNQKSVLFNKNASQKVYPASTTKLLTALTVLQYCDENEKVVVGDEIDMVQQGSSKAGLSRGESLNIRMLLEGLLLPSGNDSAYVLAAHVGHKLGGTGLSSKEAVQCFVNLMNQKASEIGALSSKFLTPDGYDTEGQYTTAYDLSLIASECLKNNLISHIVKQTKVMEILDDGTCKVWVSSNELLNPSSEYYYPEAIGMKTGSTDFAGKCLVSVGRFDGEDYISVVMNSTEEGRWKDSIGLLEYGKKHLP